MADTSYKILNNLEKKLHDNGDGTYSEVFYGIGSALPSGAATSAKQDTGNTSLAAIDTNAGTTADAAVAAGAVGSIAAKLRAISRDIVSNVVLASGANRIGKMTVRNSADGADIDPLAEATFTGRVGEVDANPTTNTLLGRMKDLLTGIILATGTNVVGKFIVRNAANDADIAGDATNGLDVDITRLPAYTAPTSGELAGSATSVQMPTVTCRMVKFKANYDNAGRVYIGVSTNVTKAAGTTTTTAGLQLSAGEETGWLLVDNVNRFWRICDNAGDDLTYLVLV